MEAATSEAGPSGSGPPRPGKIFGSRCRYMQFEGGLFPLFMKKMIPKNQLFFLYIIKFVAAQPLVIEVERFTFNFQSIQYILMYVIWF